MKLSQLAFLFNVVFVAITLVTVIFTQLSNRTSMLLGAFSLVVSISTALFFLNHRAAKKH
jgi:hypothetical protein